MSYTCEIIEETKLALRKFKLSKAKGYHALLLNIDMASLEVRVKEELQGEEAEPEYLQEELGAGTPSFIGYIVPQKHRDGRTSFPLCFIFYCPPGINTALNMAYASTKQRVANELNCMKIFECRDAEELTEDWLKEKLDFFG